MSAGTARDSESEAQVRRIFAANLDGVLNTVLPVVPRMQARRRGQVGLMSSLAAFRGVPGARAFRRHLAGAAASPLAGPELLAVAMSFVARGVLDSERELAHIAA